MAFFIQPCSGCYETEDGHPIHEYEFDEKAKIPKGSGCRECGYTGKRRTYFSVKEFEIEPPAPTGDKE